MHRELKDRIISEVEKHCEEFQLQNFITDYFREYIYSKDGEYLIGGEEIAEFISEFIKLYTK